MSDSRSEQIRAAAAEGDWKRYFELVEGFPARDTLVGALDMIDPPETDRPLVALDLGCGEGRDTIELLKRGWRVTALDVTPEAFDHLLPRVPAEDRERLMCIVGGFEDIPRMQADLVNAAYVLPFCPPEGFATMWRTLTACIIPGGQFVGQFFGLEHRWAKLPDRSHHSIGEVRGLFDGFAIESIVEEGGETGSEQPNDWHVIHVIAKKDED